MTWKGITTITWSQNHIIALIQNQAKASWAELVHVSWTVLTRSLFFSRFSTKKSFFLTILIKIERVYKKFKRFYYTQAYQKIVDAFTRNKHKDSGVSSWKELTAAEIWITADCICTRLESAHTCSITPLPSKTNGQLGCKEQLKSSIL
jgi:hypothetical protein